MKRLCFEFLYILFYAFIARASKFYWGRFLPAPP